jgi:hypothetical protein
MVEVENYFQAMNIPPSTNAVKNKEIFDASSVDQQYRNVIAKTLDSDASGLSALSLAFGWR